MKALIMNRKIGPLTIALLTYLVQCPISYGAKLLAINKDNDKIILKLSRMELAQVTLGEGYFLNVTKIDKTLQGTVSKINPLKSTAVLKLDKPHLELKKNQKIVFLPSHWAANHSSSYALPIQYKHKNKNEFAAELLLQESFLNQKVEVFDPNKPDSSSEGELKVDESSSKFSGIMTLEFVPDVLGMSGIFAMHEGDKKTTISDTSDTLNTTITSVTVFNPDVWYQVEEFWTIGGGLIHTFLSKDIRTEDTSSVHNIESDQFSLSVMRAFENASLGFEYTHRSLRTTGSDIKNTITGEVQGLTYTVKRPSTLKSFYKSNADARNSWSLGAGYTFWERDRGLDELAPAAAYPEMLQLNYLYEARLDSGNKLDSNFYLHGSKTENHLLDSKEINVLGMEFKYRAPINYDWAWSTTFAVEGGLATTNRVYGSSGSESDVTVSTDGFSLIFGGAFSRTF